MHRTQISLEEAQYQKLILEAQKKKVSLSAIIRQLINEYLQVDSPASSALKNIAGIAEGDGQAVGRNHNQFLYGKTKG